MRRNSLRPMGLPVAALALTLDLALAFGATGAGAAPREQISIRVQVADLNMQSVAGAKVALRRIRNAAQVICGDDTGVRDLGARKLVDACVRATVTATVASAHSPALAALNGTSAADAVLAAAD